MGRCVFAVVCGVVLLAGCSGPGSQTPGIGAEEIAAEAGRQQYFQVQSFATQAARLEDVAFKVLTANANECRGNIIPRLGFRAIAQRDVAEARRQITTMALKLDEDRPTVISVVSGGPAAKAGMLPGDIVTRVDGRTAPKQSWKSWLDKEAKNVGVTRPMKVEVRRGSESKTLAITPMFSCNIPVELVPDTDTNAYTDSKKIVIFTGVMRVAATDSELAVVVGHELAHVTMGHRAKKQQNMVAGAALGLAADVAVAMMGVNTGGAGMDGGAKAGFTAYALDFEREADYVGAYYAARAGFPLASEPFWRAMAQENPKSITFAGLHPTAPERFLLMQKTQAEIAEKMRLKQPLIPERKASVTAQAAPRE